MSSEVYHYRSWKFIWIQSDEASAFNYKWEALNHGWLISAIALLVHTDLAAWVMAQSSQNKEMT